MWDPDLGRRRCTATAKGSGQRCLHPPIRGSNVCRNHGGAAPQVQQAAKVRLAELIEPALRTLRDAMDADDATWSDRLRAAADVLDRGGYPKGATLEVTADELAAQIRELARQADER